MEIVVLVGAGGDELARFLVVAEGETLSPGLCCSEIGGGETTFKVDLQESPSAERGLAFSNTDAVASAEAKDSASRPGERGVIVLSGLVAGEEGAGPVLDIFLRSGMKTL
mmetsp:Transcript_2037/g.4615  ORF Transcript_2037/g.4615 Transcript_2037/m.4615 type:complete len:110 (+) Transcript_2037:420-749(+)